MYPIVSAFEAALPCCVVLVNATSMRPNRHHHAISTGVLAVFDDNGMIQMLKQELAAYKVATENVSWPEQDHVE